MIFVAAVMEIQKEAASPHILSGFGTKAGPKLRRPANPGQVVVERAAHGT